MSRTRVTLFSNGVSNATPNTFAALANLRTLDPTKYVEDFTDFHTYDDTDLVEWDRTEVGAGTRALTDGIGGRLLVTNAAADNDSNFFQRSGEAFQWAIDKEIWFRATAQIDDVLQSDYIAGLFIRTPAPIVALPTDGLFFVKSDPLAAIDFQIRKDGTATTLASVATMVAATDIDLAFHYDGVGRFSVYVDGVLVVTSTVLTNAPDDELLSLGFGVQNGEAVAKVLNIDWIGAWLER